ncbi:MAG: glycoside hydrolase family 2 [Propionibacteriales bacterium]|nr:glycoside hydrolase family 2 [Propionibacteriales bacterium]
MEEQPVLPPQPSQHPRPQLVREEWTDLGGPWGFAYDDDDAGITAGWQNSAEPFGQTITVPYPPESKLSGIHDPGYHPVVWYRREIATPELSGGDRLLLHFGAVDYAARVWFDGTPVGEHEGGHTPFSCDVTDAVSLAGGGRSVVVVRAEDRPTDVTQPRGKQDWEPEPHGIFYHRTTGIWQPVWLERVPAVHIAEVQWTPDVPGARARLEIGLNVPPPTPLTLRVRLRLDDDVLAEQTVRVTDRRSVTDVGVPGLRRPKSRGRMMWSPASPSLVDADLELRDETGVVDRVGSYLGFRTVGIGDGRFLLNGLPFYVRGVLEQGYWPESHLAAPDADALRREVELIRKLGFNTVRIHQKVEDPRFLYWCDRLGLMVWGEMANAFEFGTSAVERLTREWLDVLRRDRSHPCIVTWVPMNESWGIHDVVTDPAQRSYPTALYHLTKSIDPTRPVISNDGWEHTESDIWSVHDYAPRGAILRERYGDADQVRHMLRAGRPARNRVLLGDPEDRGQAVMLTEFGGVRFTESGQEQGWGHSAVNTAEDFDRRLEELFDAVLDSPELAGFCYTQLTDTEQERNGLLTESREPKLPMDRIRKLVRKPARSIMHERVANSRRAANRPQPPQPPQPPQGA